MKPTTVSTSAASSGFAAAIVVIIVWLAGLAKLTIPVDVATALGTIITSVTHFAISISRKDLNVPKP